ncbi:cation:proton antiporter [Synechocystis salina]|uniref:Cation:proton antiporter n=1 Tax=Synechocystis salina LEGE 00031 TaxID=1828736 RepID=A0ABR9VPF0_9SYNC|nr:cation:proton antiporter [Synechocystis salina]MBE9241288.1 cation:proton antiporter [Synechocystis salina LEGE 00041]MBE9252768.1 cation:proton antiporter [Synechocystis salina LEGE 00031]
MTLFAVPAEFNALPWLTGIICLSLMAGFSGYLLPATVRFLTLAVCLLTLGLAYLGFTVPDVQSWVLLDSFGVTLQLDALAGYFLLTNALVTLAVLVYCWNTGRSAFFYAQLIILHTSLNSAFLCADFMSLYVALEVVAIAAFCLMTYPREPRIIWLGLRYLLLSNTAMLFYLIGVALVYTSSGSFAFSGLTEAPPEAIALIFLGLLTKGGIFLAGLWLPQTHGEAATPVSAVLSGVVVKAGILPLLRCSMLSDQLLLLVEILGVATAVFGVAYAMLAKDSKRMLAFHTVSQMGFVLAAPVAGGFYALTHGLVKSSLFLLAGNLPSRDFKILKKTPIAAGFWIPLVLASSSIAGFPLLAGFEAKTLTLKGLPPWLAIALNIAAVGTAISFSKFVFLKPNFVGQPYPKGLGLALVVLLGGLAVGNVVYWQAFTPMNLLKATLTCVVGAALYWGVVKKLTIKLPDGGEKIDHLIGMMSVSLTLLFAWILT